MTRTQTDVEREASLEADLDDVSEHVRDEARKALRLLPDTAHAARASARATGLVGYVGGSLMGMSRSRIAIRPFAVDETSSRDLGVPVGRLTPEGLARTVAAAPLSAWGKRPHADWIAAAARTEGAGDAVLEGWMRAAVAERDQSWLDALASRFPSGVQGIPGGRPDRRESPAPEPAGPTIAP